MNKVNYLSSLEVKLIFESLLDYSLGFRNSSNIDILEQLGFFF